MKLWRDRVLNIAVVMAAGFSIFIFNKFSHAQFSETISLPQALLSHTAIIWQNRIYVAGGVSDTGGIRGTGGFLNNVYYSAEINADGSLSEWKVANNMPEFLGLGLHGSVIHNGMIYVLGGTNMFGPRDVVYYASVNSDGSLGEWKSTTPMPNKLMAHSAVLYNNRIYVTGGIIRSVGATSDVFWAEIMTDGTIGTWKMTTSLPHRLFGHKAVLIGNRIFVIGGTNALTLYNGDGSPSSSVSGDIYSSEILADGNLGTWQKVSQLPEPLTLSGVTMTSKNIYVLGGYNGTGISNAVYFAPILENSVLGDWQSLDVLPVSLVSLASVSTPDYLYALGGGTTYIDGPQSNIYYTKIKSVLKAFVKIMPTTINKHSKGKWITAIVGLPETDVRDIIVESVRISAINGKPITPIYAETNKKYGWIKKVYDDRCDDDDCDDEENTFKNDRFRGHKFRMFKFNRQKVQEVVPEGKITVRVEGSLKDGRTFSGENTNWVLNVAKLPKKLLNTRSGTRTMPNGIEVNIPGSAFPGNPDLILTVETEDINALSEDEKGRRNNNRNMRGLHYVSEPVVFGPHGMQFENPITIGIPYNPAMIPEGFDENNLVVYYWNSVSGQWEEQESEVSVSEQLVRAQISHFSVYQVMAGSVKPAEEPAKDPAKDPEFKIGEVYVFPNPVTGSNKPKFHIEASGSDRFFIKIYTLSGRVVCEIMVSGAPQDGKYEYEVNENFTSGIYYYFVKVSKGNSHLKKTGKFAVVR